MAPRGLRWVAVPQNSCPTKKAPWTGATRGAWVQQDQSRRPPWGRPCFRHGQKMNSPKPVFRRCTSRHSHCRATCMLEAPLEGAGTRNSSEANERLRGTSHSILQRNKSYSRGPPSWRGGREFPPHATPEASALTQAKWVPSCWSRAWVAQIETRGGFPYTYSLLATSSSDRKLSRTRSINNVHAEGCTLLSVDAAGAAAASATGHRMQG